MPDTLTIAAVCAVCAGEPSGLVMQGRWQVCDDPRCTEVIKHWSKTGPADFTAYEREAADLAGRAAGKALMEGGETDLKRLSKNAWADHVRKIITTYRTELQRLAAEKAPPF